MKFTVMLASSNRRVNRARQFSFAHCRILLGFFLVFVLSGFPAHAQRTVLVGSGSTVPAPLFTAWGAEYAKQNPNVQLRFVPVGTEEGLREVSHGSGDFAAGEMPLTEKERTEEGLTELPAALIGIAPIYNLPRVHELRLSGEVLAEIFLGGIKSWKAPQIAKLNPGVDLPDLEIKIIHRTGGKGSNYVFSDFLSKSSAKFHAQVGMGLSPKWPVGESAERSSDMANRVKAESGSIGYVEFQYAAKADVSQALVLNASGKYVKASSQSLLAACESVEAPGWHGLAASLINTRGAEAYPLTSFTWMYLPAKSADSGRATAVGSFLRWIFSDGQRIADEQGYTALPSQLLTEVKKKLAALR